LPGVVDAGGLTMIGLGAQLALTRRRD